MGKRVFVSYSRNDGALVETLVADARSLGHDPWVDRQLLGGQVWWDEVVRRIRGCDAFVFAMSRAAVNSKACETEYKYAAALGKPILPVLVRDDLSDSLMPSALSALQRVDYTTQDKNALSALVLGLNSLPQAPVLPDPLPPTPEVPATYLYDLKQEIDSAEPLTTEKQEKILQQLTERIAEGNEPRAMGELLERMEGRDDLLVRTAGRIGELKATLGATAASSDSETGTGTAAPPTVAPAPAPTPQPAVASAQWGPAPGAPGIQAPPPQTPQAAGPWAPAPAQSNAINGAWWLMPIFLGFIGGLIAWAVNKEKNEGTAKTMLIVGIVMSVVWAAALAGG
jgi:hypothetical protein